MQRTAVTALAAAAVATGWVAVPSADAATLEQLIQQNTRWTFEDDSAETIIDRDGNNTFDVGDSLRGVVAYRAFQPTGGTTQELDGVQNSAVHGLFRLQVTEKTPAAGGFTYQFGPDAEFEGNFGDGAMIAIWEDQAPTSQLFPFDCTSVESCETAATAGDLALVLGFDDERENVFAAGPLGDDLELARNFPPGANIAPYAFRMNVLENNVTDLPFIDVEGSSVIPGVGLVDFPAQAVGSGQILGTRGTNSPFPTFDDADVSLAVVPVPAALPLFLAGLGALGMIGWRRNAV